jgi:DNA-binding PucR family transcriptional regulator
MDEWDAEIIIALADNNMNITKASRVLYVHRNTVEYHIRKVKLSTGLDPTNFYDLCKLLQRIKRKKKGVVE